MTELKVHTYTAAEPGIFVNSYPMETTDVVTHPNPDHFKLLPGLPPDQRIDTRESS
jgi:hypothetical protein